MDLPQTEQNDKDSIYDSVLRPIQLLKKGLPQIFTTPIKLPRLGGISDIMVARGVRMSWSAETVRIMKLLPKEGIFHTGIESSDPVAEGIRRNQLIEAHDFYSNYEQRLERIADLGITWLRFGIPYSVAHPGPNQYDFSLFEKVLRKAEELGITIIADLLHFGLPEWLHEENTDHPYFQNSHFPPHFADYAEAFARRFPQINFYTIVNEPFVTANLSAKVGLWNETKVNPDWRDDKDFVRAIANIAKAALLARQRIEKVWKEQNRKTELLFVQNESFEAAIAKPGSHREAEAYRFNLRRFGALDLIFGKHDPAMREYLISQGLSEQEYQWFMENGDSSKTILGIDHYPWCVYILDEGGQELDPLARYQLYELTKVYYQRYELPLLHTEINGVPELAVAICKKTYDVIVQLRDEGYPMLGMGWYGDEYQVGWQFVMVGEEKFNEYPVGLYYKGELQPVASLFHEMSKQGLSPSKASFLKKLIGR
jgi:Glycosyl hydrolase family 1